MRRDKLGGDPLPHQGKYSGSFKFIAILVCSMLYGKKIKINNNNNIYIFEYDKNSKNIAMHAIFLLEMMNSCSVNISLVSSTQLSIFLSMDHLAHIRPP